MTRYLSQIKVSRNSRSEGNDNFSVFNLLVAFLFLLNVSLNTFSVQFVCVFDIIYTESSFEGSFYV